MCIAQLGGNMKPSRIRVLDLPFTAVEWVLPEELTPAQYLGQDKWMVWERSPLARERSLFGYWDDADDGQLATAVGGTDAQHGGSGETPFGVPCQAVLSLKLQPRAACRLRFFCRRLCSECGASSCTAQKGRWLLTLGDWKAAAMHTSQSTGSRPTNLIFSKPCATGVHSAAEGNSAAAAGGDISGPEERLAFALSDGRVGVLAVKGRKVRCLDFLRLNNDSFPLAKLLSFTLPALAYGLRPPLVLQGSLSAPTSRDWQ